MRRVFVPLILVLAAGNLNGQKLTLWYRQAATDWQTQALPLGNGRLGAMIFGGAQHEHIQLNENSLWTGDEKDTGSYQNLADLYIDLEHGQIENYRRQLDLDSAVHTIEYLCAGTAYRREYFASVPAGVLVFRSEEHTSELQSRFGI